jgi:hypothetical protein
VVGTYTIYVHNPVDCDKTRRMPAVSRFIRLGCPGSPGGVSDPRLQVSEVVRRFHRLRLVDNGPQFIRQLADFLLKCLVRIRHFDEPVELGLDLLLERHRTTRKGQATVLHFGATPVVGNGLLELIDSPFFDPSALRLDCESLPSLPARR